MEKKTDYDKYFIVPKYGVSKVNHRKQVSLDSGFMGSYPIFSSPMAGISGSELVIEMGKNNCIGLLHRFFTNQNERKAEIDTISKSNILYGVAIGIENFEEEYNIAKYAISRGAKIICIDIASGYLESIKYPVTVLKNEFPDIFVMSGNVVTSEATEQLKSYGVDFVRVGIGISPLCDTREVTGIGRNQILALQDCSRIDVRILSDGGIDKSKNMCKSFAAGADFAMLGSSLAYSFEAENKDGEVWGMASKKNMIRMNKEIKSIEGNEGVIDVSKKKPLKDIIDEYLQGVRSSCTYLGCFSYLEMRDRGKFELV